MATLKTLFDFNDGEIGAGQPEGGVITDAAGDLLGTAGGGLNGDGMVFELAKTGAGYASTPTTLASFNGDNGLGPDSDLVADAAGNLFSTTYAGGAFNNGTAFELAKTATGYASTPTTLVSFRIFVNGYGPEGGLAVDSAGDLFGTTSTGGYFGYGTVFELVNSGSGYSLTTLANFSIDNGANPMGTLVTDAAGDLFGMTNRGGAHDGGTVFEIAKTGAGYASTPTTLVSFDGPDAYPAAGLIMDAAGNLFGTTTGATEGGANNNDGTVFELVKTGAGYASTPTTLVLFNGTDGSDPEAGLTMDAAGNLFGTTRSGGLYGEGTVFELAKTGAGYASTPTTLISFLDGTNGSDPRAGLTPDAAGDLFGTTSEENQGGHGTIFELTDTGFVTCYLRGTRIAVPAGETAVEDLRRGDLVVTANGENRPIIWIGYRKLDCRNHPDPRKVCPVRIKAGAFAPNLPRRDLLLSPQHAIFAEDVLIPAKYLVNGTSVVREPPAMIEYFHVELQSHDLLLAEGLAAESYLDTGDRGNFENGGGAIRLHPDFAILAWDVNACAELMVVGPEVDAVKAKLARRAPMLASATSKDGGTRTAA